ncbi:MAG: hypothetical protein RIQ81_591 [Pseudomonadota bacterium]|jgi:hypothetical protein
MSLVLSALVLLGLEKTSLAQGSDEISRVTGPFKEVPELFFDARTSSFTRDGRQQIFEGDVISLGAGNIVSADKIAFDQSAGVIEAEGHIVVISSQQVFTGERLRFFVSTGDFRLDGAQMTANDPEQATSVSHAILGFSKAEIDYELARQQRLSAITAERAKLREASRLAAAAGEPLSNDLVDRYAILLEQEDLLRAQENPALARLGNDRRLMYQRRRIYWEKNREDLERRFSAVGSNAFFRIGGETIERKNGNDFQILDSVFTSCKCDPGEAPAWSVRAQKSEAQIGGYADFRNAVVEIKGVPVFYLPYMRLPIKDTRQSGFLLPIFSFDNISGSVFSQPVFFDLGRESDVTVATEVFEKRGTRLALEARHQTRKNAGWSLNIEGLRDQIWLRDVRRHQMLYGLYSTGLANARAASQNPIATKGMGDSEPVAAQGPITAELGKPDYWNSVNEDCLSGDPVREAACDADLRRQLSTPQNVWRGSMNWKGLSYLTPRTSIVTSGVLQTDHRYEYDLYLPDDFQSAVLRGRAYPAFNRAGIMAHHDGRDFYVGVGSRYADNIRSANRFDGEQLPLAFSAQSRLFDLLPPDVSPVPLYGNVRYRNLLIRDHGPADSFAETSQISLGDGHWQSLEARFVAPVSSRSAVKVDQFLDGETRLISAAAYGDKTSQESSWRLGLRFQLPIDGIMDASGFLRPDPASGLSDSRRIMQHLMNWSVTFATRPVVVRNGPYGVDSLQDTQVPTYFQSDRDQPRTDSTDMDLPEDEQLRPYQTVTLTTSHRWRLFTRGWRLIPADLLQDTPASGGAAPAGGRPVAELQEIARKELLFALDRPLKGYQDMFSKDGSRRFFNRYRNEDRDHSDLLSLSSGITYDFRKAGERRGEESLTRESRPWSEPYLDLSTQLGAWGVSSSTSYNIYDRVTTRNKVAIVPPGLFNTTASFGYSLDKEVDINPDGKSIYRLVTTRTLSVATTLIPTFNLFATLGRRSKDNAAVVEAYETRVGASFDSTSGCWGIRFLRTKEYDVPESSASYLLQLAVTFMGQTRSLPNMAAPVVSRLSH